MYQALQCSPNYKGLCKLDQLITALAEGGSLAYLDTYRCHVLMVEPSELWEPDALEIGELMTAGFITDGLASGQFGVDSASPARIDYYITELGLAHAGLAGQALCPVCSNKDRVTLTYYAPGAARGPRVCSFCQGEKFVPRYKRLCHLWGDRLRDYRADVGLGIREIVKLLPPELPLIGPSISDMENGRAPLDEIGRLLQWLRQNYLTREAYPW